MRSDARKRADAQPHWDPAVCALIERARAEGRAEVERALEGVAAAEDEVGDKWARVEVVREAFALGAAWALGDDEEAPAALKARAERAEAERDALAATLREVLGTFHEKGHPGRACVRSGWIAVEGFARWQSALRAEQSGADS